MHEQHEWQRWVHQWVVGDHGRSSRDLSKVGVALDPSLDAEEHSRVPLVESRQTVVLLNSIRVSVNIVLFTGSRQRLKIKHNHTFNIKINDNVRRPGRI